jgi:hypothetical protein
MSTRVSVRLSELGPYNLPRKRVRPPPLIWALGGATLASDERKDTLVLNAHFNPSESAPVTVLVFKDYGHLALYGMDLLDPLLVLDVGPNLLEHGLGRRLLRLLLALPHPLHPSPPFPIEFLRRAVRGMRTVPKR